MLRAMSKDARFDDGKIHLKTLGGTHEIDVKVRVGRTRVSEMLPLLREVANAVSGIAITEAEKQGKHVSCKVGCWTCCSHLVPVSVLEARRLAEVLREMPEARRIAVEKRFSDAVAKLEAEGLRRPGAAAKTALVSAESDPKAAWEDVSRRYFALQIPCPFLESGSCSIYEERPIVCREYSATTPAALCDTLNDAVETVPLPFRMTEIATAFVNKVLDERFSGIPLVLALEWARDHATKLERGKDGEKMFWSLMREIEKASS